MAKVSALDRIRRNLRLFVRFGVVGATGVLVNLLVIIALKRLGPDLHGLIAGIPFTDFNVRWYHVFSTIAFCVACLWNFQLNRRWTFNSAAHAGWWEEFRPFFSVGLIAQFLGLGILTLLMHAGSPFALPTDVLDDSSGWRTRLYWAQLVVIAATTPLSFVLNKLWTFSAVRGHHTTVAAPVRETEDALT